MSFVNTNALAPMITGGGLSLHTNAGTLFINGSSTSIAAADTALTANATNYVYIDLNTGLIAVSTSSFPVFSFPIATAVCDVSHITTLTDSRADFWNDNSATANTFATLTSATANPAGAGQVRLASADTIDWRNNANGADIALSKTGPISGVVPADVLDASGFGGVKAAMFLTASVGPASAGIVRLANADAIKWRNNAGAGDISLAKTGALAGSVPADTLDASGFGGVKAQAYITATASPADAGAVRLANADGVAWRNAAGAANVTLAKTGAAAGNVPADMLDASGFGGVKAAALISSTANPAAAGIVRLAKTDAINFRNNANGGDVSVTLDTSDRVVLPATILTASVSGRAALNLPTGAVVSSPGVGDIWVDTQVVPTYAPVASSSVRMSGLLASAPAQTPLTNVTTIQTGYTLALPAGILNVVGKTLRISGTGIFTNASGSTATVTMTLSLLGTVVCAPVTGATVITGITNGQFQFEFFVVTAATGGTGNVEAHGGFGIQIATSLASPLSWVADQLTGVSSNFDLTAAGNLLLRFTSTFVLSSLTVRQVIVELLN